MSEPGFWDDQARAQKISTEHARVSEKVEMYERLTREFEDARDLYELDPAMDDEIAGSLGPLRRELERLEEAALFNGEYDADTPSSRSSRAPAEPTPRTGRR